VFELASIVVLELGRDNFEFNLGQVYLETLNLFWDGESTMDTRRKKII